MHPRPLPLSALLAVIAGCILTLALLPTGHASATTTPTTAPSLSSGQTLSPAQTHNADQTPNADQIHSTAQIQGTVDTWLKPGSSLTAGDRLSSGNGQFRLELGATLREFGTDPAPLWQAGAGGRLLAMQTDGNLVLYGPSGALWSTGTHGNPGAAAALLDDGNLVVWSTDGRPLWFNGAYQDRVSTALTSGQAITSPDRRYRLAMQPDGNLVQYGPGGAVVWNAGTYGNPGARVVVQSDGNLVVWSAGGQPLWWTGTTGTAAVLALQSDGNLVLYTTAGPVWSSIRWSDRISLSPGGAPQRVPVWGLVSADGRYRLLPQPDGNLVLWGPAGPVWSSGTWGNSGAYAVLQGDANLVVYRADGRPLWASGRLAPTSWDRPVSVVVGSDGQLRVTTAVGGIWSTRAPSYPGSGSGRFTPAVFPAGIPTPAGSGRTVRFSVEIEDGVSVDPPEFAGAAAWILLDAKGWQGLDGVSLRPVQPAELAAGVRPDIRVTLASPATVDRLCAPLNTAGEVSCWNGSRAMINVKRWVLGATPYGNDLAQYRVYLISHEVGHGLGHHHVNCPGPGRPAPVMVQQTYGLQGCTAWPWPRPPGAVTATDPLPTGEVTFGCAEPGRAERLCPGAPAL